MLTLTIIFAVYQLKHQNAMSVCLPWLFQTMAVYYKGKGDFDKAEEIAVQLLQRKEHTAQDFVIMAQIDLLRPVDKISKRPYEQTLEFGFEK